MTEAQGRITRQDLQARAVEGTIWTAVHVLVSIGAAFIVNIVVARVLGAENYGRLAVLTAVIGIASMIATMGIGEALVQFGSKAHAAGRRSEVRDLLQGTQGFRLLVAAPLTAAAVLVFVDLEPWLLAVAVAFGVAVPAFLGGAPACLTIENKTAPGAKVAMITQVFAQGAVLLAALLLATADAVWAARLAASAVAVSLALVPISPDYRDAVLRPRRWHFPRAFWVFAIPMACASLMGALTSNRVELFSLELFADPAAVGIFALAFGVAAHVYAPAGAFIGPLIPALSGLAEVDAPALRHAFERVARIALPIVTLFTCAAVPALAALVPLLYGDEFASSEPLVLALGVGAALSLLSSPFRAFAMARLGGGRLLVLDVLVLLCIVLLCLLLVPPFGLGGAVAASLTGALVRFCLMYFGEAKRVGITRRGTSRRVLGVLILGPVVAPLAWAIPARLDDSLVHALAAGGIGALLFTCTLKMTRVGMLESDRNAVAAGLRQPLLRRLVYTFLWPVTRSRAG